MPTPDSPIKDVTFGQALKISLDNYYDILKAQVGGLATNEYLQLKAVADPIDISSAKYKWFSYYNLLRRSDQAIDPTPVSDVVLTAPFDLVMVYEKFLRQLRGYVVKTNLSADDQKKLADIDLDLDRLRDKINQYAILDRRVWKDYAELMGYSVGDSTAFFQWSASNGHLREIEDLMKEVRDAQFAKKTLLDKQYPEPTDREIVDAEFDFENPGMRLRYPIFPDSEYPNGNQFNVTYLATLPLGSSALFDDRRVITWDISLESMQSSQIGAVSTLFDRNTSQSSSITTDWSGSASGSYFSIIKVNASASEHTQIQDDFNHGTTIKLSSAAAYKAEIVYPSWFRPTLFKHKHVVENIHDFEPFFGSKGSLLYIPSYLIVVRGFKVEFSSSQEWTFDYQHKFSASAGGGFNVLGISFGGSGSYTNEVKEHTVDKSTTTLTIADAESTLRFVGYAVKKNTIFEDAMKAATENALGQRATEMLNA